MAALSNFTFLDGASHPHELVDRARMLGLAGIAICDTNTLGGVVRAHVAAKGRLAFRVGCRLVLEDGSVWLAWPADRASYGRLTALLSQGRMAVAGQCRISRAAMVDAAEGWVLAAVPPGDADAGFAARLRADARALHGRLARPLFLAAACGWRGDDQRRLDRLAAIAAQAGAGLLAIGDVRFHDRLGRRGVPGDRRAGRERLACARARATG